MAVILLVAITSLERIDSLTLLLQLYSLFLVFMLANKILTSIDQCKEFSQSTVGIRTVYFISPTSPLACISAAG